MDSKNYSLGVNLFIIAFLEGFFVISFEIISKGYLTPYFGNSISIWTIILGNTFLFIGLGYYFSQFFFKKNNLKGLANILIIISILIILLPSMSHKLNGQLMAKPFYLAALVSNIVLLGPIFFLFGLINPLIINIITKDNSKYGATTGFVFFVSTFGGIIASLIITIIYFKQISLEVTTIFFGFLLFIVALIFLFKQVKLILALTFSIFIVFAINFENRDRISNFDLVKPVYFSNNLFGDLKVYDAYKPEYGISFRYLTVNNIPQSIIFKDTNIKSDWNYVHRISMFSSLKKNKNALLLGMGGGTIASELQKLNMNVDIVDIDQRMFQVAEEFFYFKNYSCNYFVNDARFFINKATKKYDLIILDVLNGESQPVNLFTQQGFQKMKQILKKDGIIITEFQEETKGNLKAYKSLCNTLIASKYNVYSNMFDGQDDIIILASPNKIDSQNLKIENFTENTKNLEWLNLFFEAGLKEIKTNFDDGIILDDKIPILDKLLEKTKHNWRKNNIQNTILFN
jgi:spermidine synthase